MTPAQINLARHALGLPNDKCTSYRNRFVGPTGSNKDEWDAMVAAGHAYILSTPRERMKWYALTRAGALAAIYPGEALDPEDFQEINHGL